MHIAVAAEALAYAEALGLEAGPTWEVLRHGAATSFMLDDRGARMVDNPNNEIKSTIDIFVQDMGWSPTPPAPTPAPLRSPPPPPPNSSTWPAAAPDSDGPMTPR